MTFPEHWVIGLFEGEGSIIISKRYNTAYLKIKSTDLDVLRESAINNGRQDLFSAGL